MSSNEDNDPSVKKRKAPHRPCDVCRRRKRRCNGGDPCGRCIKHELNCTYEQRAIQRTSGTSSSYVQALENRLKTVEALLRESNMVQTAGSAQSDSAPPKNGPGVELLAQAIRGLNTPFPAPHSDDLSFVKIAEDLDSLSLNNPGSHGFLGKSSQAMLVKAAVDLKRGHSTTPSTSSRQIPLTLKPWRIKPWEDAPPRPKYAFPEDDLMIHLVSLYFTNIHIFFPLFHRPTFEGAVATNMHFRDDGFAGTLLLVCALGARYSDDPRVNLPDVPSHNTAGWKWFSQVQLAGQPLIGQATLYDLQCYGLAVQFLDRASGPRAGWTLVGVGVRLAQDIGIHRQKSPTPAFTPEEELEKRAYWVLILFDSQLGSALGRSFAIQSHDFDLVLPIPCDDEYWEAGPHNAAFCQPPETPSLVHFFTCLLSLNRILSFTLKILYSTNRISTLVGMGDDQWQEKVAVEFDSQLTAWFDSVPAHLRWDPACPNNIFFDQAAALQCTYYFVRILIHRPFIPAIRRSAVPTNVPSLSICNNAARSCIHVAEIQHQRRPNNPLVFGQTAVFTAGVVLLLNIWGGDRGGRVPDSDLSDVHKCISVLRGHKTRWTSTGPLLDTLEQLVKVDQGPPERSARDDYEPSPFVTEPVGGPRHLPAAQAFNTVLYDPIMSGHFVGTVGEEPGRPPRPPAAPGHSSFSFPATEAPDRASVPDFTHGGHAPMDMNTVTMWSAAPTLFEVSDWDLYLSNIADMMQQYPPPT
ncbi:fungal-specific transcription factor domain-containing protein [Mycena latifolia]|nr:fungal-specific transcription factor domain-containing protein [Mycena latifolia]